MTTVDRTQHIGPLPPSARPKGAAPVRQPGGPSFQEALQHAVTGLQLSTHAQKRVERRDLDLDPARMQRLDTAITRAAAKGSRSSVVMLDDLAVVVDVRQRTVVTALNAQQGKERVFTNIDSVVIA
jgi:flagellar operon protein